VSGTGDTDAGDGLITRRQWLTRQAILNGATPSLATEAVSSVAIEHPEWNLEERKTMEQWEGATT
jgi:hypothetical protein